MKRGAYLAAAVVGGAALIGTTSASAKHQAGVDPVRSPQIVALGNSGVCDLSSHRTFRMVLRGWAPYSTVQIVVQYPPAARKVHGPIYPYLANNGQVQVNGHGNYTGFRWTCWPVASGHGLKFPDIPGRYIASAYQTNATAALVPEPTTSFRIVK